MISLQRQIKVARVSDWSSRLSRPPRFNSRPCEADQSGSSSRRALCSNPAAGWLSSESTPEDSVTAWRHSVARYRPETKAGMKPEPASLLFLLPWRRQPSPAGAEGEEDYSSGDRCWEAPPTGGIQDTCRPRFAIAPSKWHWTRQTGESQTDSWCLTRWISLLCGLSPQRATGRGTGRVAAAAAAACVTGRCRSRLSRLLPKCRCAGRLLPHSSLPSRGSGLAADSLTRAGRTLKRFGCLSTCSRLTPPQTTVRIKSFDCFVSSPRFLIREKGVAGYSWMSC